jgi:hypothetical protein
VTESQYIVYRWEDETMTFERHLFIRHDPGVQVTREGVLEQVQREIHDFKPGLFRVIPVDGYIDLEVRAEAVFS